MMTTSRPTTASDPYLVCWDYGRDPSQPCWGKMQRVEYALGFYVHYCEGHGNPLKAEPYRMEPERERK
jgi:hypothetical protein